MKTRVTELLGIEYPIIQGGMAWVADHHIAAAVSEAGGLGLIAAANAPAEWVREQIREAKKLTDKTFGVNIMLMSPSADEVAKIVVEEGIKVVTTGAGSPEKYMEAWKAAGVKVIPVVASVALARRMERCGADAVVAEGTESGGHIGETTTMALVPQVVDAVKIPVIAAGGIADGRGIAAAFMLGAEAVQMGTRFVATEECHVHENYKQFLLKARDIDTRVTGRTTGHPVRTLRNPMTKEYLEAARAGKIVILLLLFVLFGIMSPAIAKLTPWMMETLSDSMAGSGFIVTNVQVDALTSWTQFFKNIPIALIAFVLIFSDIFTKEYKSGTLLLILTKGLSRYKAVLAKAVLLLSLWTVGYGICFAITYGYNAYFWDNHIMNHLLFSVTIWWLFGVWVICLMVLFSSLLQNNAGVILCVGGTVLLAYLLSIIPKVKAYSPTVLMNTNSILMGVEEIDAYVKAIVITVFLCIVCVAASIPVVNKRQL